MVGSTHSTTVRLRQAAKKSGIALYRAYSTIVPNCQPPLHQSSFAKTEITPYSKTGMDRTVDSFGDVSLCMKYRWFVLASAVHLSKLEVFMRVCRELKHGLQINAAIHN
jgi:hypothetical protein